MIGIAARAMSTSSSSAPAMPSSTFDQERRRVSSGAGVATTTSNVRPSVVRRRPPAAASSTTDLDRDRRRDKEGLELDVALGRARKDARAVVADLVEEDVGLFRRATPSVRRRR